MSGHGWIVRGSLVAICALTLAWLAVLLRDQELGQAASDRLLHGGRLSSSEFGEEMQRLRDAELLNPESRWELDRGKAWLARNRARRAAKVIESVVRREPDNVEAWVALVSARGVYGGRTAHAVSEVRRLDPLDARRRQSER